MKREIRWKNTSVNEGAREGGKEFVWIARNKPRDESKSILTMSKTSVEEHYE
jgi:hypothetical protein